METLKEIIANEPPTSYRRVEALRGLIQLARTEHEILDYVLNLNNDESIPFRLKWARLLSRLDSPQVAQKFAECLGEESNTHVLKALIKGIAKNGDKSFVNLLEPYLEHESFAVKHAVKMTIAELVYEPATLKQEKEIEEAQVRPSFPRHKLPWRLKLKFFYRKYKLALFGLAIVISLIPASMGVYYGALKVKEIIVSYQSKPKKVKVPDKPKVKPLPKVEKQEAEEVYNPQKPFNWGLLLKILIIISLFGAVAFAVNKIFDVLSRFNFNFGGVSKYKGGKSQHKNTSNKPTGKKQERTSAQDISSSKEKAKEKQKLREKPEEDKELNQKEKPEAKGLQKERPSQKDKEAKTKADTSQDKAKNQQKEQQGEVIDLSGAKEKKVISLSQKILFSFLERFFRLFNNNYNKNILRIFLPNDLFYKIRFLTMLVSIKTFLFWLTIFLLAVIPHFYYLSDAETLSLKQFGAYISPFKFGIITALFIFSIYGFFIANPFKLKGLNLHRVMSRYYYEKKYYFRKGEQEQWAILLRSLESDDDHKKLSLTSLILKVIFGLAFFAFVNFFILFPFIHFLNPVLLKGIQFFNYTALTNFKFTSAESGEALFLVVTLIIFAPFILMIDWRREESKKWAKKQVKKSKAESIEEEQSKSLEEEYKSIFENRFKGPSYSEVLRVICGVQKKAWLDKTKIELLTRFDNFFLEVTYADDVRAGSLIKEDFYHVWLPDNDIKLQSSEIFTQVVSKEPALITTPLVYVFRKSVLKKFNEIYQGVNYRSLVDANGKMRNLKEVDFSFIIPEYDDLEVGTYNLVMMMNEYFRTTRSYDGDVYKNKVFRRTLKEYLSSGANSKNLNKCSVFVTTEHDGIEFIHQKKGRGWKLVYPTLALYMEHKFVVLKESPNVDFLYNQLSSNQIQKTLGEFGWRPGNFSVPELYPDLMSKWSKYNVPNSLGVYSHLPDLQLIKKMIETADEVVDDG